jgi:hypothetical protein
MFHTNWAHCARITLTSLMVAATLAALIVTAAPSQARPSDPGDPGAEYELKLQDQTEKLFLGHYQACRGRSCPRRRRPAPSHSATVRQCGRCDPWPVRLCASNGGWPDRTTRRYSAGHRQGGVSPGGRSAQAP